VYAQVKGACAHYGTEAGHKKKNGRMEMGGRSDGGERRLIIKSLRSLERANTTGGLAGWPANDDPVNNVRKHRAKTDHRCSAASERRNCQWRPVCWSARLFPLQSCGWLSCFVFVRSISALMLAALKGTATGIRL
jgi:hypothetical protein